jgi:hypothetical protein
MNDNERTADDAIDLLARELPRLDVEPATAAAIRARARAELARHPHGGLARARGIARRGYRRVELPLASALAVAYLAWAVQTILMVH